jgi:hypothetical protein
LHRLKFLDEASFQSRSLRRKRALSEKGRGVHITNNNSINESYTVTLVRYAIHPATSPIAAWRREAPHSIAAVAARRQVPHSTIATAAALREAPHSTISTAAARRITHPPFSVLICSILLFCVAYLY